MILVTGANGMVGSIICKLLSEAGEPFKAMVRENSDLHFINSIPKENLVYGDLQDPVSLEPLVKNSTKIIHCAAMVSFAKKERNIMQRINVEGTKHLIDLSLIYQIEKFVHLSSISAIAINRGQTSVDENAKWPGTVPATHYGTSKFESELEVWRGSMEGLNTVILNSATVLGPGDPSRSSARLFKYVWDEKPYYTTGIFNYIDVRDLAKIAIKALGSDFKNQQFIVSSGNISYKDFFTKIANYWNKKAPHIKTTPFLTQLAIYLERLKYVFRSGSPLINRETARRGNSKVVYSNQKLVDHFNLEFIALEDSIHWTCEEMKSELTEL